MSKKAWKKIIRRLRTARRAYNAAEKELWKASTIFEKAFYKKHYR